MKAAVALAVALGLATAGCGDDPESEPLAPERAPSDAIPSDGLDQEDAAMARTVARYMTRNTSSGLRDSIERISVRKGVITVETSLRLDGRLRGDARVICDLIQGSDEADFTPGHTVTGEGRAVRCPHRTD